MLETQKRHAIVENPTNTMIKLKRQLYYKHKHNNMGHKVFIGCKLYNITFKHYTKKWSKNWKSTTLKTPA